MTQPQALRKHDGRIVAFDVRRVSVSIARAARASGERPDAESAAAFGAELGAAAAGFLARESQGTPGSADVRELVLKLLRETGHARTAEAYAEHARAAASFLWSLRVGEGGASGGPPWDRRRLIESLRASGVAGDPAGELARDVERRLAALGEERVSPALVHALAALGLRARGLDGRVYSARRVSASFAAQAPRYDAGQASVCPLPGTSPALEAFWLQAVHSPEIASAAQQNELGLAPLPSTPDDFPCGEDRGEPLDPLKPGSAEELGLWFGRGGARSLRCDGPERSFECARLLAALAAPSASAGRAWPAGRELRLMLRPPPRDSFRSVRRAWPITLNVGGALVRAGAREQQRATLRMARLVSLAAQAHREREEYFGLSHVRGRELPIAAAGLWNAGAWLAGEPYERGGAEGPLRAGARTLTAVIHGAVTTLRQETGMHLTLWNDAPEDALRMLWRRDRDYFARDGLNLDADGRYASGLGLRAAAAQDDLGQRLDFLRGVALLFDDPPPLRMEAPIGLEPDAAAWRELLQALLQSGLPSARLAAGGSARGLRLLARQIRAHLEGFPLFEGKA